MYAHVSLTSPPAKGSIAFYPISLVNYIIIRLRSFNAFMGNLSANTHKMYIT